MEHRNGWIVVPIVLLACACGCVRRPDVQADRQLHGQAQAAFEMGDFTRAKALIRQANDLYVPRAELWRRTLDLRIAQAEGNPQGELRRLLRAWAEQRSDWTLEERVDAELTLAETLQQAYAQDWLYDLDSAAWPASLRTRYHLLFTRLQEGNVSLRDERVTRWRLGVRGLYDAGNVARAAQEAEHCARQTRHAEAALIAAKLWNELGDEEAKTEALSLALELSKQPSVQREVTLIRTAPAGTKCDF